MQSISQIKTEKDLYNHLLIQDFNHQTILVIEDSPQCKEAIQSALGVDYRLIFAARGKEGVDTANELLPLLILLDVRLVDVDGYKVCARLQANPSTRAIPVILISSLEEQGDVKGFSAGAMDYLASPIQPSVIRARVRNQIELKRCRDLLENPAPIDLLTNIADRIQLIEHATREWRRAIRHQTPQSLMIMDIDGFKAYNELYGRLVGDDCLRQIAGVLIQTVKREPDLAARYGGDEFACLLPETDACGAIKVANTIQEAIEELNIPFANPQGTDHVTLSFGIATLCPAPRQNPNLLFDQAELMLCEAQYCSYNQTKCWQGS